MEREAPPPLELYRKKRDPDRTPEPFGGGSTSAGGLAFVVQKHAARRLHYDFRLEMDGVLKSWAVPKGPSVVAEDRRLAVHVEDHPLEYGDFEGVIPAGNYGAGAVIVWDQGRWQPTKPEDPLEQLRRGKIELELFGYKLRGRWTLARMGGGARASKGNEWLLLKKADGAAGGTQPVERYPQSVFSGLTIEEMREPGARLADLRARLAEWGPPARDVAGRDQPFMLATLSEPAFSDPAWLFEIKYDGVRVMAERRGDRVELRGRSGDSITARYPEIARALARLPVDRFLVDGEIVAPDESGRPSFQQLQGRMHLARDRDIARAAAEAPVSAVLFDCLALDGRDLRRLPLAARKEALARLVPPLGPVRYGDHVVGEGEAFYAAVEREGLEGMVAKRADSGYEPRRSRAWLKIKCQRRQEFVIGGYTTGQGARAQLGALHVGLYDRPPARGGRLVYTSKVGTGFDDKTLRALLARLAPLARDTSPFASGPPGGAGHHWVEPRLVCEVRFTEWTRDGGLRHPAFLGLRDDKRPEECVKEVPVETKVAAAPAASRARAPLTLPFPPTGKRVSTDKKTKLTNLDKVFWPEEKYTKGDLIAYYEAVAPWLLPYLRDRPLVLTRYPDGIAGKSFFQKDAPDWTPDWVRTERIWSKHTEREIDYFIVNDVETLRYVVNSATIPLHLWSAHLPTLDRPDWLVIDLDPKGAPFTDVVRVARAMRRLLEELTLPSYPKTSGATGLHILLPMGARYATEEVRTFARLLAVLGVEAEPKIATIARPIGSRGGKVYVDWGQNGHGQTIVAPLSVRPRPGAPVSCPLRWSEVTERLDPGRFTIKTMPERLAKVGDPGAPVLTDPGVDIVAAIGRMEARLAAAHARKS